MIKQYFKQAWNLMKQNRFYSAVYIIGTGLAISMVMVIAIAYHIRTADIAPETHRDRMLYVTYLIYKRGESSSNFFFGPRAAKECLLSLQTAEGVAVTTDPTVMSLMAGNSYAQLPGGGDPYKVQYYPDLRRRFLDNSLDMVGRRLNIAVNLFLLVNVFLAVIGTFWFRVNRRRGELGLRMALGSSRSNLRRLVMYEGLLLMTLAAIPALLVCFNLAYLELLSTEVMKISAGRLLAVSLLTWGILAAIICLAVWYPSRKASRLEPAEALHYE